ncbi:unnamed protein product [Polarella glacialis]|uniref:ATP-dependent DNA helicase n=1 Tax=Polarella glacialis TaxID=89957 RepID=A0A813KSI2_POLGL|nr:unnamed protein product [Polarella glacialis]
MVACTASTGIVAASLGGCTIHSFAGVGIAKLPPEENIARVANNINSSNRWRETQVLVLDEVSMIDASLFTLLEKIARRTRGVDQPWGGLQLIVCGDFLQLPPVESNGFAFETEAWRCMKMQTAELVTPIRQQGDKAFLAMLSEIRIGICSSLTAQSLSQCSNAAKPAPTDGIAPTRLYCVNKDVDAENAARLAELPGAEEEVRAMDEFKDMMHSSRKKAADQMDKAAPSVLKLKIGAQVILTKNNPSQGIVNGTRGVIESWGEKDERGLRSASVRCDNGSVVLVEPVSYTQSDASGVGELLRIQLPLKLGWALTVHRAQGCTLSRAELQLENAFDCGQVYVALSRVKSLAGLWIKGKPVTQKEVKAHPVMLLCGVLSTSASCRRGASDERLVPFFGSASFASLVPAGSTFAMAGLEERYQKAVAWESGKTMPNDRKLLCYGFFKQAAVGDVDGDQPYAVQFEKRSKWDAWNAVKGMSKEEAMKNYIEELEKQIKDFDPQNPGF